MTEPNRIYDNMTHAEFEQLLPELFASGNGHVSTDPRLSSFLETHPDCAALVRDLETIAAEACRLFEPREPSDSVWARIQDSLQDDPIASEIGVPAGVEDGTRTESGKLSLNGEPGQLVTGGSLHDLD